MTTYPHVVPATRDDNTLPPDMTVMEYSASHHRTKREATILANQHRYNAKLQRELSTWRGWQIPKNSHLNVEPDSWASCITYADINDLIKDLNRYFGDGDIASGITDWEKSDKETFSGGFDLNNVLLDKVSGAEGIYIQRVNGTDKYELRFATILSVLSLGEHSSFDTQLLRRFAYCNNRNLMHKGAIDLEFVLYPVSEPVIATLQEGNTGPIRLRHQKLPNVTYVIDTKSVVSYLKTISTLELAVLQQKVSKALQNKTREVPRQRFEPHKELVTARVTAWPSRDGSAYCTLPSIAVTLSIKELTHTPWSLEALSTMALTGNRNLITPYGHVFDDNVIQLPGNVATQVHDWIRDQKKRAHDKDEGPSYGLNPFAPPWHPAQGPARLHAAIQEGQGNKPQKRVKGRSVPF